MLSAEYGILGGDLKLIHSVVALFRTSRRASSPENSANKFAG